MFAVIRTGGKQYKVVKDDIIAVEKLQGDEGADVVFDDVLALGDKIGTPTIEGAAVAGKVVRQARGDKVVVFKKQRRQNYRRTRGHRQSLTYVQITDLEGKAKTTPKKTTAKKDDAATGTAAKAAPAAEKSADSKAPTANKAPAKTTTAKKSSATPAEAKSTATKKAAPKKAAASKTESKAASKPKAKSTAKAKKDDTKE